MEHFWRRTGFNLGRRWPVVLISFLVITAIMAAAAANLDFATGQDSYLDDSDQIAIDNELFQDEFSGETIILLFQAEDGSDISTLYNGDGNVAELERIEEELRAIPEVYAVVAPLTTLRYSEAITSGVTPSGEVIEPSPGTGALLSALEREPDDEGKELRQADVNTTLARLGNVEDRDLSNPDWVDFLMFGNQNVEVG